MVLRGRVTRVLGGALLGGLLVASLLACNEVAGIEKPLDGTGTGTGPGPGPVTGPVARFVGDWKTPNGSFVVTGCQFMTSRAGMAILHLTAGDQANTIIVTPDLAPTCHITTVLGSDANTLILAPQQHCDVVTSMETDHYEYVDGTMFKIGPANNVLVVHIEADVTSTAAPGVVCQFEENSTYAKQ